MRSLLYLGVRFKCMWLRCLNHDQDCIWRWHKFLWIQKNISVSVHDVISMHAAFEYVIKFELKPNCCHWHEAIERSQFTIWQRSLSYRTMWKFRLLFRCRSTMAKLNRVFFKCHCAINFQSYLGWACALCINISILKINPTKIEIGMARAMNRHLIWLQRQLFYQ